MNGITWGDTSVSDDLIAQLHDRITGDTGTDNNNHNNNSNNGKNNTDMIDKDNTSAAALISYADAVSDHAEAIGGSVGLHGDW